MFTIANKQDPNLFLTAPKNPTGYLKVYLDTKIPGTAPDSHQQLWRLIPADNPNLGYSKIQNYIEKGSLYLNIPGGQSSSPIQMMGASNDGYEEFYIDCIYSH